MIMKRQPVHKDNYEEYFLLYVDDELTPAEREEVEAFISQHPDLGMELQMLLDTKLDVEDIPMAGREKLYRQEEPGLINQENVEEFQVLMLDGELDKEGMVALEQYHDAHEEARNNFNWLKKSKLDIEAVTFPNKAILYRTAQKPASIVNIRWYRIAAAAAVLITAGLLWIGTQQQGSEIGNQEQVARNNSSNTGTTNGDEAQDPKSAPKSTIAGESTEGFSDGDAKGSDQIAQTNKAGSDLVNTAQAKGKVISKQIKNELNTPSNTIAGNVRQKSNFEKPDLRPSNDHSSNGLSIEYAVADPAQKPNTPVEIIDKVADEYNTAPNAMANTAGMRNVKTNYAAEALNNEAGEDDDEEMDSDSKQRKGLRGIVRKANRFYNKVTNPDTDKPVVKVANFEIGLSR